MALKLAKETNSGIVADYWRVLSIYVVIDSGAAQVELGLYLDEVARRNGKEPVYKEFRQIKSEQLTNENMDIKSPVAVAYEMIKTQDEFVEAEDVLEASDEEEEENDSQED